MLDKIKSFLGKAPAPIEDKPKLAPKKIAIVVGHEARKPGMTIYNKTSEYFWNRNIAEEVVRKYTGRNTVNMFLRDHIGIDGVARQLKTWEADVVIELHLNASGIEKARGCEVLALDGDELSQKLAQSLAKAINSKMKIKLRHNNGVFVIGTKDRGVINLRTYQAYGVKKVVIVEPFFADFKNDESAFIEKPSEYVSVLIDFIDGII